jgi:hypothetical protein
MKRKKLLKTLEALFVFLIVIVIYFAFIKTPVSAPVKNQPSPSGNQTGNVSDNSNPAPSPAEITYTNNDYGFEFALPMSWKGYSIVTSQWQGYANRDAGGQILYAEGPELSIRHPLWREQNPRQDIPIMIFTAAQWNDLQQDKFHIGAAPIGPSELGGNIKYVFALPARYNFAFPTGYEEVEQILAGNPLHAFWKTSDMDT